MNDEIKEINITFPGQILDYVDTKEHLLTFFNYITNLQQQLHQASLDIQELTERDIKCPSWCDKLTNLQQEIKHISKVRDEIIEKYNDLQQENETRQQDINNLTYQLAKMKEENEYNDYCNKKLREKITNLEYKITTLEDYKSRCEKASKVIKNKYPVLCESEGDFKEELLNILEGENNGN